MKNTLLKNVRAVNEGKIFETDIRISRGRIEKIASAIPAEPGETIIDGKGKYLLPGMIDDQVHFREPGLTHKADLLTESRAAVAGGITSFIDMPNTLPQTVSAKLLEEKFRIAEGRSYANYSFMLGGTNDNLDELLAFDRSRAAGIKLFLGSSTGNMLVDDREVLERIFSNVDAIISVHCEDETTIRNNLEKYRMLYGDDIPMAMHPQIRSEEACYLSSSQAVALAKKTGARLHVFHLSTASEMELFDNRLPTAQKKITAEVCIHHLLFDDNAYLHKGSLVKWNPAIKGEKHRKALWKALLDGRIDVIATDHAPHTLEEKTKPYIHCPSGAPMVQHALPVLLDFYQKGQITLTQIVQKTAHNPAILFRIKERGYIREGYHADLTLVDMNAPWEVKRENILYKCGWSPLEGLTLSARITHTFVNGVLTYKTGKFTGIPPGRRMEFAG